MRTPPYFASALLGLVTTMVAASPADAQSEPSWPQTFTIAPGERTSFGFAAGSPGAVSITATWPGGASLTVSLRRTDGSVAAEKTGTGNVSVEYTITAADIVKGVGWAAGVKSNAPPGGASNSVVDQPFKATTPLITGQLSVTHPPGSVSAIKPPASPNEVMASGAASSNLAMQRNAALHASLESKQSATLSQMKSKLQPPRSNKAPSTGSGPTAAQRAAIMRGGAGASTTPTTTPTAAPTVAPTILSLSASQGEPNDPILITGKDFGDTPGEIHFVVGNNNDKPMTAATGLWTDSQIIISVPPLDGIPNFSGYVYVKLPNGAKSPFVPFRFIATTEYRTLALTSDAEARDDNTRSSTVACHVKGQKLLIWAFTGGRGDDEYFLVTHLKNGWVTDAASLGDGFGGGSRIGGAASAAITELRAGTDSPYLKVHWWYDAFSWVRFCPEIVIRGPKGVPNF